MPNPVTIDRATKVNVGILATLLGASAGGAGYLTMLNSNFVAVSQTLSDVRKAIDRNTAQLSNDGKALAVLESFVSFIDRRVSTLESNTKAAQGKSSDK